MEGNERAISSARQLGLECISTYKLAVLFDRETVEVSPDFLLAAGSALLQADAHDIAMMMAADETAKRERAAAGGAATGEA
jgi:hypothetical protein